MTYLKKASTIGAEVDANDGEEYEDLTLIKKFKKFMKGETQRKEIHP